MDLVMLAAGIGKRFNVTRKENQIPKCLVQLDAITNKNILELNIENIQTIECIKTLNIVVGFKSHLVMNCIEKTSLGDLSVNFKYNENYKKSVLYSVIRGFEDLKSENLFLINGDTFFSKQIFSTACDVSKTKNNGITLFGYMTNNFMDDDMLINVTDDKIEAVGKSIEKFNGVSSGAILFSGNSIKRYFEILKNLQTLNQTHHSVLQQIISEGGKVNFYNLDKRDWIEIDKEVDIKKCHFL